MKVIANRFQAFRHSPYLTTVFRLILGLVFLTAGLEKIGNAGLFAVTIQNYQLIPMSLTNLIAIVLPWLEFYCGLLLLLGWRHQMAAGWAVIMNLIFVTALLSAYLRGLDIECGCFGSGNNINLLRIFEDFLLFAFALHIFLYPVSAFALENRLSSTA